MTEAFVLLYGIFRNVRSVTAEVFCVSLVKAAVGPVADVLSDLGKRHFTEGDQMLCNVHSLCDKRLLEGHARVYFHEAGALLFREMELPRKVGKL